MTFFKKMFGGKGNEEKAEAVDFITALSMQIRGEVEPALNAYLRLQEANPEDNLALFFSAAIAAGKGEVAEAAGKLRNLSRDIASRGDSISRAIILEVVALESQVPIAPVAQIMVTFAEALKEKRFIQEAAVCLEVAAGLLPENGDVLYRFGDTLHDLRVYDYAESVLQNAITCSPNHWGALYTYAVLLQDLKRDEEALQYYDKAVKLNPDHPKSRNNYGAALLRTDRLEQALEQCSIAQHLDPHSPLVKVNLGNIHLLMEDFEQARSSFAEAIALNENFAPAYFGLGRSEELLGGDPVRVRDLYIRTIQLDPSLATMHPALSELLNGGAPVARTVN